MKDAAEQKKKKLVYGLWFVREETDRDDIELLIGIYESELEAKAAIKAVAEKPGFVDFPEGLQIFPYVLGQTGWVDGFIRDE